MLIVRKDIYSLSFSILGMTLFPFFIYDARKPSTEKIIKGGRTKLKAKAAGVKGKMSIYFVLFPLAH